MRIRVESSLWVLLGCTALALAFAWGKDPDLPRQGLQSAGRLFGSVWLELTLGFVLAGLIDVLVPAALISRWLGSERLHQGILAGWAAGLLMPGGPYLFFPVAAKLFESGTAPGALIAFLTAKTLVSPVRTLTYEAPLLGWPLTFARFLPAMFLPPLMGWIGQWLYDLLKPR